MKLDELKLSLKGHWSFRLFILFPSINYFLLSLLISFGIYVVGLLIFTIAGEFKTYVTSLLPYLFTSGFILVIVSYGWWENELLKMLIAIFPALEISGREFNNLVRQWDRKWINSIWAGILFGIPFAILNFRDVIMLWTNGIPKELQGWFAQQAWGIWISSSHSLLFGLWYGFLHIFLESFVLGSGVAGVIATILLIKMINDRDLKLAYYKRLDVVVGLGANLAFWVLIALTAVSLLSRPAILTMSANFQLGVASVQSREAFSIIASTIIQVVLAFLTLIGIFGLPVFMCRETIKKTKSAYITNLLLMAEKLYSEIKRISQSGLGNEKETNLKTQRLEQLHKQLSVINSLIQEIDKISAWPGTMMSGVQVFSGFSLSIISPVAIDWLKNIIKELGNA